MQGQNPAHKVVAQDVGVAIVALRAEEGMVVPWTLLP
jgi:hypothetical protein